MFLSILGDNCGLNTLDAMVVTNDWLCYVCADYIKYDNVPHGSPKERQDVRVTLVPLARYVFILDSSLSLPQRIKAGRR